MTRPPHRTHAYPLACAGLLAAPAAHAAIDPALRETIAASGYLLPLAMGLLLLALTLTLYTWRLNRRLHRTQADLAKAEAEWTHAMDFLDDPMYLVDLDDRLVRANRAFYRQIGLPPAQAIGRDVRTLIHLKPEDTPCPVCAARLERRDAFFTKEPNDPSNPTGKPLEITIKVIRDTFGAPIGVIQGLRDMSHLRAAEQALRQEQERAHVTLQSIGDAVITTDVRGRIDRANPVALQLLDIEQAQLCDRHHRDILHIVDEISGAALNPIERCLSQREHVLHTGNNLLLRHDGQSVAVNVTAAPILDSSAEVVGAVLVLHDVTEMRGMARQLSYQATHDALTGLINRQEFEIRLQQALDSARVDNKQHALIYLDLDQFKVVNDTCGHLAGDELLKQVAALLVGGVRNVDTLARLGGDEFGVLLEACPMEQASVIAEQLRALLRDFRFAWEDKVFEVGASFGLVPVSADSGSRIDILSAADTACYVAKDRGRNRVHAYLPDDSALARHHGEMHWVHRITHALDQNRFELFYQTIRPLADADDELGHFEILLRMRDEQGGLVLPGAFIPAAERYQLMPAIDRWVIRNTFEKLQAARLDTPSPHLACAINLSGQSLCDEDLLDYIVDALDRSGLAPHCICFEITETAAIANLTNAKRIISALKAMGVRFALDDFGSGLSSFGYLKNLSIDYLKIDGSFVRDIVDDPLDRAMVSAINEIGHLMGIDTIAEFVETPAALETLRALGVDFGQGYAIDPPRPLSTLVRTLPQSVKI